MRVLIDANVAIRCMVTTDVLYSLCKESLLSLIRRHDDPVLSAQVLAESWGVLTRPMDKRGGFDLTPSKANEVLKNVLEFCELLPEPPHIWTKHHELLLAHSVSGVQVHDCRLAAWCSIHGIDSILTLNPDDFKRYDIKAIHPKTLA